MADNLGTIRDLATYNAQTGVTSIVNHRVYDSFGNLVSQVNPATGQPAAVDCVFGYTGKYFDTATGLQYNIECWYDPATGRWASQDPAGYAAGDANLYGYVGNAATGFVDPSGLCQSVPGRTGSGFFVVSGPLGGGGPITTIPSTYDPRPIGGVPGGTIVPTGSLPGTTIILPPPRIISPPPPPRRTPIKIIDDPIPGPLDPKNPLNPLRPPIQIRPDPDGLY